MKKDINRIIGIIFILWGIRSVIGTVSFSAVVITGGAWERYLSEIVAGVIISPALLVVGIMLVFRRRIVSVCTAVCGFMGVLAVYDIISSVAALFSVSELMNTPDAQLPGLNSLAASLGFLSVWITLAKAALYIAAAVFTVRFFRSGKYFVPTVLFTLLSAVFTVAVYHGRHLNIIILWIFLLSAAVFAKRSASGNSVTGISSAGA